MKSEEKGESFYRPAATWGNQADQERGQTWVAEALAKHPKLLLSLINRLPICLWTTDDKLTITSSLGAGLAALNLRPQQLAGVSLFDYLQTDDPEFLPIAAHLRALQGESVTYELEWLHRRFRNDLEPLRGTDGEVIGCIGLSNDLTDSERSARSAGRLTGEAVEDLNDLLTIISGYSELVLDELAPTDPARDFVAEVRQAGARAGALVHELVTPS